MLKFKKEYEDTEISIPSKRLVINRFNIHEEHIQKIIKKNPRYAHNFEPAEGGGVQEGSLLEGESAEETKAIQPEVKEATTPKKQAKTPAKTASKTKGGSKK